MQRGFDEFFGFIGGKHRYIEDERRDANGSLLRGTAEVSEKEYLTDAFSREACAFIDRNRERPFFLYLAPNAVHVPLQTPPAKYLSRVKDVADESRRNQLAILSGLDELVGTVRGKLSQLGLAENTLVVFMSDNGGAVGNKSKNGKLRGVKTDLFEGGIRVPLILNWPGKIAAGVDRGLAGIIDLCPTFLAAAGVEREKKWPASEGADLLSGRRHEAMFWRYGPEKAARSGKWKLVAGADGVNHLFDLESDFGEANDLAEKEPQRVKELLEMWKKWDANNVEPKWDGYQKNEQ
jgi:arylsulfatase A-like enzyme